MFKMRKANRTRKQKSLRRKNLLQRMLQKVNYLNNPQLELETRGFGLLKQTISFPLVFLICIIILIYQRVKKKNI